MSHESTSKSLAPDVVKACSLTLLQDGTSGSTIRELTTVPEAAMTPERGSASPNLKLHPEQPNTPESKVPTANHRFELGHQIELQSWTSTSPVTEPAAVLSTSKGHKARLIWSGLERSRSAGEFHTLKHERPRFTTISGAAS